MLFWLICALLTVAVAVLALRPVLRLPAPAERRHDHDLRVYKDQLDEIDRELGRGTIGAEEGEAARNEISRRILAASDADRTGDGEAVAARGHPLVFTLASAAIVLGSLGFYLYLGSPGAPGRPYAERANTPARAASVQELIARVEARLREVPDDGKGWDVLAPVYAKQGRYDDAVRAYERAIELLGESRDRLRGYAEAHLARSNGIVDNTVRQAFRKILAKEPELIAPRFWLAVGQEQDGDRDGARAAYENLLVMARKQIADGKVPQRVAGIIEERLAAVGGKPPTAPLRGAPKPDDSPAQAIARLPAGERAQMIENMVQGLAERLEKDGGERAEWERLIRSYWVLGRKEKARNALANANRQFAGNTVEKDALDAFARQLGIMPQ